MASHGMPAQAVLRRVDQFPAATAPLLAGVYDLTDDVPVHAHDFLEIAVVAGGSGVHVTATGTAATGPGDVFVLRPGAWHGFAECRRLIVANCCIAGSALHAEFGFVRAVPEVADLLWAAPVSRGVYGVHTGRVAAARAQQFAADIDAMAVMIAGPHHPVAVAGALLSALSRLLPVSAGGSDAEHESGRGDAAPASAPVRSAAVERVVDQLLARPERDWRLGELAALVSLDPAYLSRLFRDRLGVPPIAYLSRVRAERAAALLTRTSLPVSRVGAAVGWTDPNYFARRFRSLVGVSPSAYRMQAAGDEPATHRHRPPVPAE